MDGWSYFVFTAKIPELHRLNEALNTLGADGWELVTSLSTVKSWINVSGNDMVLLFKRQGVGHTVDNDMMIKLTGVDPLLAY